MTAVISEAEQTNTFLETVERGDGLEAVAVFEYGGEGGLMDLVQRSIARTLDLQGADKAATFAEILDNYPDPAKKQEQIEKVGAEFDEALINFVIASMVATKRRNGVIRASNDEGFNGVLLWESKLDERTAIIRDRHIIEGLSIATRRFKPCTDLVVVPKIPTQRDNGQSIDDQRALESLSLAA